MYRVEVDERVKKALLSLPPKHFRQVQNKVEALRLNPRPQDVKPLEGVPHGFRIDSGEYRILYTIDSEAQLVSIFKIKHRKDVYRNL